MSTQKRKKFTPKPAYQIGDQVVKIGRSKLNPGDIGIGKIVAVFRHVNPEYDIVWDDMPSMNGRWLQRELVLVDKAVIVPERATK